MPTPAHSNPPGPPAAKVQAWLAPALLGVAWALLYLRLAQAGALPGSAAGLPVPAAHYYSVAAAYALPVCLALSHLFAGVCCRQLALPPEHRPRLRAAFALPLLALLVLPEHIILSAADAATLKPAVRLLGPLTLMGLVVWPLRALAQLAPTLAPRRRLGAMVLALLATGLPMALLLR